MFHSSFEQIENRVHVRCRITQPSHERVGSSFRRNIGKVLDCDVRAGYSVSTFPVSLIRDTVAFKKHCEQELRHLPVQIGELCDLHIDLELNGIVQRVLFPEVTYGVTYGPLPSDAIAKIREAIAWVVDHSWTSLQSYYVENVTVAEATGMTSHALHGVYKWFWTLKDGPGREFPSVDNVLTTEYLQLARSAMHKGDDELAAQYSKIVLDLSSAQKTDDVLIEFNSLKDRWNELAAVRENEVKKIATVAREGIAEHWKFASVSYYRRGLVFPLTEELREFFVTYNVEKEREKLLRRSATNPYRRGFELIEAAEAGLGPLALLMWGIVTEWPLEALRLRIPTYMMGRLHENFPLSPDMRATKFAEVAQMASGELLSPQNITPTLYDIHKHVDSAMPSGLMTSALCQLEDDKERER